MFSLAFLVGAVLCAYRFGLAVAARVVFLAAVVFGLFLLAFYTIANRITAQGITDSVMYHLQTGFGGADLHSFVLEIASTLVVLVLLAVGVVYGFRRIPTARSKCGWVVWPVLGLSFLLNPGGLDLWRLYAVPSSSVHADDTDFVLYQPISWQPKKNLVFLYLESLERTYLDNQAFPGLTPNLQRLAQQGLYFTNVQPSGSASWTMGGMVASQCGLPLVTAGSGNSMANISGFLPNAVCLGDVLAQAGYRLSYLAGADLSFAGKGEFYRSHGFSSVQGLHELQNMVADPAYRSGWGLYDDTLFGLVAQEVEQARQQAQPFAVFSLTLDTHFPEGHIPASCAQRVYGSGDNPMLNAVHCSDYLIGQFVDQLFQQAPDDLIVVLASDHLAMPSTAQAQLERLHRSNLLLVLGAGQQQVSAVASQYDTAPTVLGLLGLPAQRMGYGVDLLSEQPSLMTQYSPEQFDQYLRTRRQFFAGFWALPSMQQGVQLLPVNGGVVSIAGRRFNAPVLFSFQHSDAVVVSESPANTDSASNSQNAAVHSVFFNTHEKPAWLQNHLRELPHDDGYLWVDACSSEIATLWPTDAPNTGLCYAYGRVGAGVPTVGVLSSEMELSALQLQQAAAIPKHAATAGKGVYEWVYGEGK